MKTFTESTKKIMAVFALVALTASSFGGAALKIANAATDWDVSGNYVFAINYEGTDYNHDVSLTQAGDDSLTGSGTSGAYAWTITSGSVTDDSLEFDANYTASPDAVTPQTVLHVEGTIAEDGSLSGTWSDNYQGGERSGTWESTSGMASGLAGSLAAEDFGVVDYDTGLGQLSGYSAGFGLTDATFENAQSVVVKLYAGETLLQTNTATAKLGDEITGNQISAPFDVSGDFDYATDGFWTNSRESEYGQSEPATRVEATVTLENGKIVTAENTNLAGDPETIYPEVGNVTTNAATAITSSDATLNGMNNENAAIGHSFWASLSPFSTESSTLPSGVYSTPDLGAIAANTPFSASLSSVSGLPAITEGTTYYFAAWTNVDGTWYPGEVLSFSTEDDTIGGEVVGGNGVLEVTSIDTIDSTATANGNFEDGWEYVFNITVPTDEPDVAMKFANWLKTGGSETIPAANNIRISSAQANNGGATVLITGADTYSTPALHMTGDLNPSLDGLQVKVTVETRIPSGTANGSYTTSYGVMSN